MRITTIEWSDIQKLMLTIEQCNKILKEYGKVTYSNDEVKAIREFLYQMAKLQAETNLTNKIYE